MAETDDTCKSGLPGIWDTVTYRACAGSSNANEALTVSLVTPANGQLKTISSFHPKFTYPIFGEEEQIFGYQGLKINLRYNASDMRPQLSTSYGKKFKAIGETEPADIEEMMKDFLPEGMLSLGAALCIDDTYQLIICSGLPEKQRI